MTSMDERALERILAELRGRSEPAPLVPRSPWNPDLSRAIDRLLPASSRAEAMPLKSALLLWNDDLDGCHAIAQEIKTPTGSYLHAVMHRREPDYSNAKYWFGQFSSHPVFPQVRESALQALKEAPAPSKELSHLGRELRASAAWDGSRMVDACQEAARTDAPADVVDYLRRLQQGEIALLAEFSRGLLRG